MRRPSAGGRRQPPSRSAQRAGVILAGDVGGTKTNLALVVSHARGLRVVAEHSVRSRAYSNLTAILTEFLGRQRATPARVCLGVAGPIVDGRCHAVNLPWAVEAKALAGALKREVTLLNDLEATAYGIETLPPSAFAALNAGAAQPQGAIAVIAAGTGLGEAALIWDGTRYRAVPTEGGHTDFAPRNELEISLLRHLQQQFGHVSYERVLSGPGKIAIYRFLKEAGHGEEPPWLTQALAVADPSPVISEMALSGRSPLCRKTLELFVSIYGAEAGNLALKVLARGGLYLGGGIAPSLLPLLQRGTFLQAFTDKGRFAKLLATIPVRVILEEKTALYGAAHYAAHLGP